MILIGTMNLTGTRDRGNFYCPTCALTQTYRLRARRPWLTLYFIPTVPVGGAELFVQCDKCRSTWDPSVLEMDQQSHEALKEDQFRDEAVRAALLVVLADGHISKTEIESLATDRFPLARTGSRPRRTWAGSVRRPSRAGLKPRIMF